MGPDYLFVRSSTTGYAIIRAMAEAKTKILLAEDDAFMVSLLADGFASEPFSLIVAHSGPDVVAIFKKEKPALLILDIVLPQKTGLEALEEIRQMPEGKNVPAIVLSNLEEAAYVSDAERLGVLAYLVKANIHVPEVVAKVKEVLSKNAAD